MPKATWNVVKDWVKQKSFQEKTVDGSNLSQAGIVQDPNCVSRKTSATHLLGVGEGCINSISGASRCPGSPSSLASNVNEITVKSSEVMTKQQKKLDSEASHNAPTTRVPKNRTRRPSAVKFRESCKKRQ